MVHTIVWRVRDAVALDFWFARHTAEHLTGERDGAEDRFEDPEGLRHALIVSVAPDEPLVATHPEIPGAMGVGETGPRLGSRAFPRTSAIIFTVLAAEALDRLVADLKSYCAECGERLKMLVWGVQEVVTAG
jgi:glyoxalase family protein